MLRSASAGHSIPRHTGDVLRRVQQLATCAIASAVLAHGSPAAERRKPL